MKPAQYGRYSDQIHLEYFWMEKSLSMNSYPCRWRRWRGGGGGEGISTVPGMIHHGVTNFCVSVTGWSNCMPAGHLVTHKHLQKVSYTVAVFLGR